MDIKASIKATKREFENSFATRDFYNKQTQDAQHLDAILEFLPIKSGMKILDLGTGSGYLAFAIAKRYPKISVVGLDIVENALEKNREKAKEENINNLSFVTYAGIDFPFADKEFDMVISRYALHHFPDIHKSISEVSRILNEEGLFFVSDPTPNDNDSERFVDAYMQLKKDGHIKFYTVDEWKEICQKYGMNLKESFDSSIRFPKKKDTAYGFEELLNKYDKDIIAGYELEIVENEIYVTERVNNLLFCKCLEEKSAVQISLFEKNNIQYKKEAALLLEDNFPHAYKGCGMEEIEECLEDGKVVLMAVNEGHLIGFIGASSHYDGNVWELHPLVVDKNCQFQGIGTMLINALEKECANRGGMTIYLGTDDEFEKTTLGGVDLYKDTYQRIENIGNLKKHPFEFYQKCGYKIVGVVPDANGYGKPDIMMAKRIGKVTEVQ